MVISDTAVYNKFSNGEEKISIIADKPRNKPAHHDPRRDEGDYNPYAERKVPKPTNDFESMLHIIKGILGTGILAMPEAFKNSGIFLGFLFSIANALLCTYAIHVTVHCLYVLCKRNRISVLTYTNAMRLGFQQGPAWAQKRSELIAKLADFYLMFYQVGACCVYSLFVVLNMKSVADVYMEDELSLNVFLLILIVPLLLINSSRNLKKLVPFSFLSNAITFLTIGVVFYYIFETPLPNINERPIFQDPRRFPLAYGTTCFAFSGVAVVFAVENNMKTPEHFGGWFGIYNRSIAILLVVYIALAFLGFWKFGEETKSSIALNLPPEVILTQVVNSLYAFAIYISYGLNGFIPIQMVWDTYLLKHLEGSKCLIAWEYLLRFFLVTLTVFLAATVPLLGLVISLFGAIALSHLLFIFPALLDMCVRHPDTFGRYKIYKVRDIFFIVYGLTGLITGVCVGLNEMILEYRKNHAG